MKLFIVGEETEILSGSADYKLVVAKDKKQALSLVGYETVGGRWVPPGAEGRFDIPRVIVEYSEP